MTAQIAGFHSRAELGMAAPRSVSHNISPGRGGVAIHWGGAGAAPADHEGCKTRWRGWQNYHMQTRGWVDIAYNFGFCDHGYILAGRGFGVRSAAQGTNDGNQRFYAAVWVGGAASTPTQLALDAAEWIVAESQRAGGAGWECRPHLFFHKTDCPGRVLAAKANQLNGTTPAPTPVPAPAPTGPRVLGKGDKGEDVRELQRQLLALGWSLPRYGADGDFGDETVAAVKALQRTAGLDQDGVVGPATRAAIARGVRPPAPPPLMRRLGMFPLPPGHWFGPESANRRNHSGYWAGDRPHIAALLAALRGRGWANVPRTDRYTAAVASLIRDYQRDAGLPADGLTGAQTWESIATSPVR